MNRVSALLNRGVHAARRWVARTGEIVASLREQAGSTEHVAGVVGQVRAGSAQIRGAIFEQGRSTATLRQNSRGVAGVSERVRATSEEQVQAAGHIRASVEQVRDTVAHIDWKPEWSVERGIAALQEWIEQTL